MFPEFSGILLYEKDTHLCSFAVSTSVSEYRNHKVKTRGCEYKTKHSGLLFSLPGNNPSSHVRTVNSQDNRTVEGRTHVAGKRKNTPSRIRTTNREYNQEI